MVRRIITSRTLTWSAAVGVPVSLLGYRFVSDALPYQWSLAYLGASLLLIVVLLTVAFARITRR